MNDLSFPVALAEMASIASLIKQEQDAKRKLVLRESLREAGNILGLQEIINKETVDGLPGSYQSMWYQ